MFPGDDRKIDKQKQAYRRIYFQEDINKAA